MATKGTKYKISTRANVTSNEAKAAGRYSVTGAKGLYLDVKKTRAGEAHPVRTWVLRIMDGHKRNAKGEKKPNIIERTIGSVSDVSLADARTKATLWASELRDGNDVGNRKVAMVSAAGTTFAEAAQIVFDLKKRSFRSTEKGQRHWLATLRLHAFPLIGNKLVADVTVEDIAAILNAHTGNGSGSFWIDKHAAASKVQVRTAQVLEWAKDKGMRPDNPASLTGPLKSAIPKYKGSSNSHAAIPYQKIPQLMKAIHADETLGARPLEFTLLTGVRTTETLEAKRSEIDLEKAQWTIPAHRTKTGDTHNVPLSRQAVALIEALPICPLHPDALFRGVSAIHPSNMTMLHAIRRIRDREFEGMKVTVHGLRSSIRDWIAEQTNFKFEVGEAVLAHSMKGVDTQTVAAYLRTTYYDKRVELMQQWADYCYGVEPAAKPEAVALIEKLRALGLTVDDIKAAL